MRNFILLSVIAVIVLASEHTETPESPLVSMRYRNFVLADRPLGKFTMCDNEGALKICVGRPEHVSEGAVELPEEFGLRNAHWFGSCFEADSTPKGMCVAIIPSAPGIALYPRESDPDNRRYKGPDVVAFCELFNYDCDAGKNTQVKVCPGRYLVTASGIPMRVADDYCIDGLREFDSECFVGHAKTQVTCVKSKLYDTGMCIRYEAHHALADAELEASEPEYPSFPFELDAELQSDFVVLQKEYSLMAAWMLVVGAHIGEKYNYRPLQVTGIQRTN